MVTVIDRPSDTAANTTVTRSEDEDAPRKMSVMGVGAKIAVPTLLYAAVAQVLSLLFHPLFRITGNRRSLRTLRVAGTAMAATGFTLNLVAAFSMLKAHREARLATGGLYRLFRDPMYVVQIFVTLPGLFLLLNSWLVLTGVIPAYLAYRVFVKEEHRYLEQSFGQAYRAYMSKVLLKI
jgi:protein-S-isoprenylcysteine O-methyltransferase Ste14